MFQSEARGLNKGLWALLLVMLSMYFATAMASSVELSPGQTAINESLAYIDANRLDQALISAKKAVQVEPDRIEAHLLYIQLMVQLNRRSEVQAQYEKLKAQNSSGLALMLWGRTLGDLVEMEAAFKKSLELDPGLGWAHYGLASLEIQRNDPEAAIASLKEAIRIQPGFTQGMESLATLYLGLGRVEDAIAIFEDVLAVNPNDARTLFQLGSLVGGQGNAERAIGLLGESLELAPDNPQVMVNLAFMNFKLKHFDVALDLYDKALAIVPNQSDFRLNREVVLRVSKGELKFEAVTEMEKAMAAKTPEEAIGYYRNVIKMNPDFDLPYLALGQLYAATNKVEEAEKALVEAVRLNPGSLEGVRMLAEFYLVSNAPLKAEPYLKNSLERDDQQPEIHAALAAVYSATGRLDKAEKEFARTVALLPAEDALPSRVNMAKAIAGQGRFSDAVQVLVDVLKASPNLAPARYELGNCYFAMEEFDRAREQYKLLQKTAPDNKELKALIDGVDKMQAEYVLKSKDHLRARHILVKTPAEADAVVKALQGGIAFEALAMQVSIAPEGNRGGDIGFFKPGELMPDFERAVLELKVGEVSGVVKTSAGYHVIKRLN